jgi:hypothetical protein
MLDQVALPGAGVPRVGDDLPDAVELVVPREDETFRFPCDPAFGLLLDLHLDEVPQNVHEAVLLPDLLPEVGRPVAAGIVRVPGAAVASLVEGREPGVLPSSGWRTVKPRRRTSARH